MAEQDATPTRGSRRVATSASNPTTPARPAPHDISLRTLKGVGEKVAAVFGKIGLFTLEDLLTHYPHRYEDRTCFRAVMELREGEAATVVGKVTAVENRPTKTKMTITKVTLDDGNRGVVTLTWFNQWRIKATFERLVGKRVAAYGVVKRVFASVEMITPEWEELDEDGGVDSLSLGRIVPIYGLTEGLSQKTMRKAVWSALALCADLFPEMLPPVLLRNRLTRAEAIAQVHFPDSEEALQAARTRLSYDELLVMQLNLAARRYTARDADGIAFADTQGPVQELQTALPFTLTEAQQRVIGEIGADMASPRPMNRLVQGDVGSGKTAVAMAALLIAARNGYQAALMAPTEILAEQHLRGIRGTLEELGVRVELLTGSRTAKQKQAVRERIAGGETAVVVGTHALIQEGVHFRRLGLAIIDEQHRFGVMQRAALSGKGANPDVLVMTATPIPRTLTLTVYGDLDVSIIDQLPPGRKPVRTHWRRSSEKESVYEGIRKLIEQGRQAFIICPLIEESEKVAARAATEMASHLAVQVFPEYTVGLLHGQMTPEEKEEAMRHFRNAESQILVSTTVIEVGVDVPNAAAIVIEDADRFGLAQLHQLRGRVGRGQHASFCILIADPKSADGVERMQVMVETNDGFRIAEEDLRLRGPGEFYGVRQSGVAGLKIADVLRDVDILKQARADAFDLIACDPKLEKPEHQLLQEAVIAERRAAEIASVA